MKLFLGLLSPTSGSAEVLGEKPYENVEVRVRLGYMPEHDCLPDAITASEFLGHMAQMSGIPAVRRPHTGRRHPSPRRARRGALPPHQRVFHWHEAARQARAGPRA